MKKIILLAAIVLSAIAANAQFSKANLQASGLTCALCTKAINKSLEKLPFVESITVDIKSSNFEILFKKDQPVDIDALRKGVEDAGFSVALLKLKGEFNNVEIKKDSHHTINGVTYHFLAAGKGNLAGEQEITIVDKNFLPAKAFKKYSTSSKMSCVQTGKAGDCCTAEGISAGTRIYHVII